MTTNRPKLIAYLVLVFFLFFGISCKKEKHGERIEKISLAFQTTVFEQAELVHVPFTGHFEEDQLKASLNGEDLLLLRNDQAFCFIIPANVQGDVEIKSNRLSETYHIIVQATAEPEADPDRYFEDFMSDKDEILRGISANLDSLIDMGVLNRGGANEQLKTISDSLDRKMEEFRMLSPGQKQVAIKYLKANYVQFEEIELLLNNRLRPALAKVMAISRHQAAFPSVLSACAEQEVLKQARCIIFNELVPTAWKITASVFIGYAAIELSVGLGVGLLPGIAIAAGIVYYKLIPAVLQLGTSLWKIGEKTLQYVGEVANEIMGNMAVNNNIHASDPKSTYSSTDPYTFQNNIKSRLNFRLKARNLQPHLDMDTFEPLFSAFEYFITIWNLPFADKIFGPKPYWPAEANDYLLPAKVDYLSVSCDNPKVTGEIGGTASQLEITFSSEEMTDQQFNYVINYDDGISGTITTAPIAANLSTIPTDYVIELYEIEFRYNIETSFATKLGDFIKTIKPKDALSAYQSKSYFMKVKYKGEYVKINDDTDYSTLSFSSEHSGLDDIILDNYVIRFKDLTNNVNVKFPIKLTLLNTFYRMMVGKTLEIGYGSGVIDLTLLDDGKTEGSLAFYTWDFFSPSYSVYTRKCYVQGDRAEIKTGRVMGGIYLDFHGGTPYGLPRRVIVYEDGSVVAMNECGFSIRIK